MQINVTFPKLERLISICRAPASGSERNRAQMAQDGLFDLILTFGWVRDLAEGNHKVDVCARTPGVKLAAGEVLSELAALIVAGAEKGDPCLKLYEKQARKFLAKNSRPPQLSIARG
jgi:hypothetical protein